MLQRERERETEGGRERAGERVCVSERVSEYVLPATVNTPHYCVCVRVSECVS